MLSLAFLADSEEAIAVWKKYIPIVMSSMENYSLIWDS